MDAAKKQRLSPAGLTDSEVLLLLGVALFLLQTPACGFEAPPRTASGQIALVSLSSVGQNLSDWRYDASDSPVAAESDAMVTVNSLRAEGAAAIGDGGFLRAATFVTTDYLSGLSASEAKSTLEIDPGRGAFSTTFQAPDSNLGPAFNGPFTSGGATQFQIIKSGARNNICTYSLAMGKTKGLYKEEFPKGSAVRIADRAFLENFLQTWKLNNRLEPEQLDYANRVVEVESVAFYHGGDELYKLKGVPGIWHEQCSCGSLSDCQQTPCLTKQEV
jgi:hypothetical protein